MNITKKAEEKAALLETATILIPSPSLYETFNSRFAKNTLAVRHFEKLLRQTHVVFLSDEPYREAALEVAIASVTTRCFALVDVVIRLILEDINVRKNGLLTFNQRDFGDLCKKHQIEML